MKLAVDSFSKIIMKHQKVPVSINLRDVKDKSAVVEEEKKVE